MAWLYLVIAGIFEIIWAVGTKYVTSLSPSWPLLIMLCAMGASVVFLALAATSSALSTAAAVWTGIGVAGVFLYSIIVFKEPLILSNLLFIALILIGIVGLKLGLK